MPKFKPVDYGPLCHDLINATLGLDLRPSHVRMSAKVHEKIATKHAEDYEVCMITLEACLTAPTYIGLHPNHPGKLELIRRVQVQGKLILVAIGLEPDHGGAYGVASAYCVDEIDVARWRQSGRLKTPKR